MRQLLLSLACVVAIAVVPPSSHSGSPSATTVKPKPITVEIWSDVVCPFCYIGKRRFEAALKRFPGKDRVTIVWRSYQLDPSVVTDTSMRVTAHLAASKGISLAQAQRMTANVTAMAKGEGLDYHFEKIPVVNTARAHQALHHARRSGHATVLKEAIMKAYFTQGRNVDDIDVLVGLATSVGMDAASTRAALKAGTYAADVAADIRAAEEADVSGVPAFRINGGPLIVGAQDVKTFLDALGR